MVSHGERVKAELPTISPTWNAEPHLGVGADITEHAAGDTGDEHNGRTAVHRAHDHVACTRGRPQGELMIALTGGRRERVTLHRDVTDRPAVRARANRVTNLGDALRLREGGN